ncbi:hypothetical protein [Streptomyces jumonjinensis]|uniref:hypothetical protein n=1 Tax=Streptomyces jumonjinensis TaxID=1945 RepID=UPI0018866F96|nr:hypothetical protein [Streptomyces jumonjinensis]
MSVPRDEAFDLVVALARLARKGARPSDLALALFDEGLPVPEEAARKAFGRAARIPGAGFGEGGPEAGEDEEEWAARAADEVIASGQRTTLVPTRARRIDRGIARHQHREGVVWPPPELDELDRNPEPSGLSGGEATTVAVSIVLRGGAAVTPQGVGDVLRSVQPEGWGNPVASLVEYTVEDIPAAEAVFPADGGMTTVAGGDACSTLAGFAETTPLGDLRAAWEAAQAVRDWALDLCARTEAELDAGEPGSAVTEWLTGRTQMSGLMVLNTLRDHAWSPSDRALSALLLLLMRQALRDVEERMPGCQWELLESPGMAPAPLVPFFRL